MYTLCEPAVIRALALRSALRAVRLEAKGFTRRGRSVTAMYKDYYGLPKGTSRLKLIERMEQDLAEVEALLHV